MRTTNDLTRVLGIMVWGNSFSDVIFAFSKDIPLFNEVLTQKNKNGTY
jgi:hypothetical protein